MYVPALNSSRRIAQPKLPVCKRRLQIPRKSALPVSALPDVLSSFVPCLSFVPAICFDAKCQAEADKAFEIAIAVPVLVAVLAGAYFARPPPTSGPEAERIFEDKETGVIFQSPQAGINPEKDKNGELVYRPVSWTPYPLPEDSPGERFRIDVGPLTSLSPRTFVLERIFPYSQFVVCTLPRPLGIVFEEVKNQKRVIVADFVEGSNAEALVKRGRLNPQLSGVTPRPGDVLRACTAVNIVYPTQSLFGFKGPQRHRVVYGAQGQAFPNVMLALQRTEVEDGPTTLVFERKLTKQEAEEMGLVGEERDGGAEPREKSSTSNL